MILISETFSIALTGGPARIMSLKGVCLSNQLIMCNGPCNAIAAASVQ